MPNVTEKMNHLLGEANDDEMGEIQNQILLIAQAMGVDLKDEEALHTFLLKVKQAVTKGMAGMHTKAKTFSGSKAAKALKTVKGAV